MKLGSDIAAVVTGGASGLGEASARGLAEAGVKVALLDLNAERGEQLAKELGGVFARCDVTNEGSVRAALETARAAHGQERICVNCAGIVAGQKTVSRDRKTGEISAHDLAMFANVVSVNLVGSFRVSALSAAGMASLDPVTDDGGRGVVVMTSSIAAEDGQMGQAAYSASKGGVAGMTLPMARDLSREGIRVVSIMPGLFHTPMFDSLSDEVRESLAAGVPFPQRLGSPGEYAALVRHICENDMLNGTAIRLDGALRLAPR
ncbi:SDR family NAD(P)-dependent oxidoreductase [Tepidamorphus sp. 3E244]|uniref:SDR family NAD(P)-dependent oxidoreductase n=1 Tax=Tepidamorphus sp. 3E244 TaxID=3385498 RepID=UPI0038FC179B